MLNNTLVVNNHGEHDCYDVSVIRSMEHIVLRKYLEKGHPTIA